MAMWEDEAGLVPEDRQVLMSKFVVQAKKEIQKIDACWMPQQNLKAYDS